MDFDHGIELNVTVTMKMGVAGHFLLTDLLLNTMIETAANTGIQGRIVNVSSNIHSWFSGDIIQYLALITRDKR